MVFRQEKPWRQRQQTAEITLLLANEYFEEVCTRTILTLRDLMGSHCEKAATPVRQTQPSSSNSVFDVMMNASKQQAQARKRKAEAQAAREVQSRDSHQSAVAREAAATRQTNRERQKQNQPQGDTMGDWQAHTWSFFQKILRKMKDTVRFNQRGAHELQGEWPLLAYSSLVQPSADPLNWYEILMDEDDSVAYDDITKGDFSLPDLTLVWPKDGTSVWIVQHRAPILFVLIRRLKKSWQMHPIMSEDTGVKTASASLIEVA